jgi:small subunit ribosomal protein S21
VLYRGINFSFETTRSQLEVSANQNENEKMKDMPAEASSGSAPRRDSQGRDFSQGGSSQQGDRHEKPKVGAMEVFVEHNIEKAMKILKRKLIKEGLFKELKSRRYYEKPSERKKRKLKESMKKARKEEARQKKNPMLFS